MIYDEETARRYYEAYENCFREKKDYAKELVKRELNGIEGRRFLDIGCGRGDDAREAFENGAKYSCGIDIVGEILPRERWIRDSSWEKDLQYQLGDFNSRLHFPNNFFDFVISKYAIHDANSLESVFFEISRIMRNGGKFIGVVPSPSKLLAYAQTSSRDQPQDKVTIPIWDGTISVENKVRWHKDYWNAFKRVGLKLRGQTEANYFGNRASLPDFYFFVLEKE